MGNGSKRREDTERGNSHPRKMSAKAKARKRRNRILLIVGELFILAVLGVVLYAVTRVDEIEKVNITVSVNEGIDDYIAQLPTTEDGTAGKGYLNVALFGVDSREGALSANTRTDTIIIASINQDTGEVKLVSVYRDTYLNVGNDSYNKCNSAYMRGGPEQAIAMLNMNLDLNIENYVTVGFKGLIDCIDSLGGVQIDVQSNEIGYLNDYQISMVGKSDDGIHFYANEGIDYTPVTNSGVQILNGLQATAYCRIRYIGNDFARTQRQRTVISQMMEQAKNINIPTLTKIAENTFPNVATSFDLNMILSTVSDIGNYEIVATQGFPFDDHRGGGTIGGKGSCVVPTNLVENVSELHEFLFGVENYQPSATVQECSDRIYQDTAPYIGY
ncbi:MAG: LCP family protein [Lachnospiraceae bacterium]|nr:LCP family protein [Lachnospiraceae bacterium]